MEELIIIACAYFSFGCGLALLILMDARENAFSEVKVHWLGTVFCICVWPMYVFALAWVEILEKRR